MEHSFDTRMVKRLSKEQIVLYEKIKSLSQDELEALEFNPQPLDHKTKLNWQRVTKKVEHVARLTKARKRFYQKHWYAKFHLHDTDINDILPL